ncbi:MAG TPA: hypothetical protein VEA69_01860 [Tepidisphaeraceae bacterium]|nr:hypothetical protein [Tepidisphaeraceae bacterium]
MLSALSHRVLPVLQLTRMALVFTAIADSTCAYLLRAARTAGGGGAGAFFGALDWRDGVAIVMVSVGLYGYGMSLNDIIDRRRDSTIAPGRPLPSGRIGVVTAHVICALLALAALAGATYLSLRPFYSYWVPLVIVVWTGLLITFYDVAGKYLVWPGLICLGLIRFFHSAVPAPDLPVLWHPLLLLNHVAILSTVAYKWEQKRPALTRGQRWSVLGMLALIDLVLIGFCAIYRKSSLAWSPGLLIPAGAVVLFLVVAAVIKRRYANRRQAGQTLMLYGLLWLIVYDAAFVAGSADFRGADGAIDWASHPRWIAAAAVFALLPVAYLSVQVMRWWSKLLMASQRPEYKRAGV